VKEEAFIAAGAVIPKDTVVGEGELWAGKPARKLRDLKPEERQKLHYQANEVR
jgi:carbonic anhydrase/acetyltransferase-like protein (isoleucine patch superfamily)